MKKLFIITIISLTSCATIFTGGKLEEPQFESPNKKYSITMRIYSRGHSSTNKIAIRRDIETEKNAVKAFNESGFFSNIILIPIKDKYIEIDENNQEEEILSLSTYTINTDLFINIFEVVDFNDNPLPVLYGITSLLTLGIIPYITKYDCIFKAEIFSKEKKLLKIYDIQDSGYFIMWSPLIFSSKSKNLMKSDIFRDNFEIKLLKILARNIYNDSLP